jgi:apolipoprotein N-acyltransferase
LNPAVRREALAVLSGVLLALSFPKFGHWSLAWVALTPLLLALPGATVGQGALLGYLTGAVSAIGILYWTALVVVQYGGLALPVGIAIMALLCFAFALFPLLWGATVAVWCRAFGPKAVLLAPFAWVATEVLRAHTFFEFPWCLLGYSQQPNPPVIQIAAFTAVYGVSFVVAQANALVAYAALVPSHRGRATAALALLIGGLYAHGLSTLAEPLPASRHLRVALVQGGIRQEEKWKPEGAAGNIERHVALTRQASAAGARLVAWPESAVPFYYDYTPDLAAELRDLVRERGVYLLFGNDDREVVAEGADRVFVGAKMLTPEGRVSLRYHKIQLVPFGEFVPLARVLTLGGRYAAKLVQQVADFTPGSDPVVGEVDGQRIAAFICYEAVFPALVRRFTAQGADLLVNLTNDAWYGRTSAPYQHLAMAAFRAVENGKYLVRAANTGITAVIDPRGRVVEETALFTSTVLVRDVPIVPGLTFYAAHGDVFAWACFGSTLALTASLLSNRGRSTGARE